MHSLYMSDSKRYIANIIIIICSSQSVRTLKILLLIMAVWLLVTVARCTLLMLILISCKLIMILSMKY